MKTVSFDDDAYDLLRGAKLADRESFSDVVKRLLGPRQGLTRSAGGWSDMDEEEAARLRAETVAAFGDSAPW